MYSVYKVENLVSGRCYIGSCKSSSIACRKHAHLSGVGNQEIAKDLVNWYERQDFDFDVLHDGIENKEFAFETEQRYIDVYNAFHGGYNSTPHGRPYGGKR